MAHINTDCCLLAHPADRAFADSIADMLEHRGYTLARPEGTIQAALARCRTLLVVLSPDALADRRLLAALRATQARGKLTLPLYARAAKLPRDLTRIQYLDFTTDRAAADETLFRSLPPPLTQAPVSPAELRPIRRWRRLALPSTAALVNIVLVATLAGTLLARASSRPSGPGGLAARTPTATVRATPATLATPTISLTPTTPATAAPPAQAAAGSLLYIGGAQVVYALDRASGQVRWSTPTGDDMTHARPAVGGGAVYFHGFHGIAAFDASTGRPLWNVPMQTATLDPLLVNGTVYVIQGQSLVGLSAADGHVVARKDLGSDTAGGLPATDGASLYLGVGTSIPNNPSTYYVEALSLPNLTQRWRFQVSQFGAQGQLTVASGVVFFCAGTTLYAVQADTGAQRWTQALPQNGHLTALGGGTLYVGADDGVYAFSPLDGSRIWHFAGGQFAFTPVFDVGTVYVAGGLSVAALDATTGAQRWSFTVQRAMTNAPAVADGQVYVNDGSAVTYALQASNGAVAWQTPVGPYITTNGGPVVGP